jgi:hypothetical protein
MVRLAESGERAEALVVFEHLDAGADGHVGVAPSTATVELAHRLSGRRSAAVRVSPRSPPARRHCGARTRRTLERR